MFNQIERIEYSNSLFIYQIARRISCLLSYDSHARAMNPPKMFLLFRDRTTLEMQWNEIALLKAPLNRNAQRGFKKLLQP